jgi:hypothetical protein
MHCCYCQRGRGWLASGHNFPVLSIAAACAPVAAPLRCQALLRSLRSWLLCYDHSGALAALLVAPARLLPPLLLRGTPLTLRAAWCARAPPCCTAPCHAHTCWRAPAAESGLQGAADDKGGNSGGRCCTVGNSGGAPRVGVPPGAPPRLPRLPVLGSCNSTSSDSSTLLMLRAGLQPLSQEQSLNNILRQMSPAGRPRAPTSRQRGQFPGVHVRAAGLCPPRRRLQPPGGRLVYDVAWVQWAAGVRRCCSTRCRGWGACMSGAALPPAHLLHSRLDGGWGC